MIINFDPDMNQNNSAKHSINYLTFQEINDKKQLLGKSRKKALEDLNMDNLLNIGDVTNARNILDVLKPARIAIEPLSCNENTLLAGS